MTPTQLFQYVEDNNIQMNIWHFPGHGKSWHVKLSKQNEGAEVSVEEIGSDFNAVIVMAQYKFLVLTREGFNSLTALAPPSEPEAIPPEAPAPPAVEGELAQSWRDDIPF